MTSAMHTSVGRIALILAPFVVLACVVVLQLRYDAIVALRFELRAPVHRSVMPAGVVRHLTFGFRNVIADYYWVTAVQAFLKWDGFDGYYPEYFRIISRLDPKFEYPYQFAILTVPKKHNPESFVWLGQIAEEGVRALPLSYQIPFSTASQYHIVAKDNARAIHFLELADAVPGAPEIVKRSHAIYLMRDATDYKKSRALFEAILETADNDETKSIVIERIELLDFIEGLEQAIGRYKSAHGAYPASVDVLVAKSGLRLTKGASALVKKFSPTIDQKTGKVLLR